MKRGCDWSSLRFAWVRHSRGHNATAWITPLFRMVVDRRSIKFLSFAGHAATISMFASESPSMYTNAERAEAFLFAWGWCSTLPGVHGTHEQRNGGAE